jgi:cell division septum initiation protein DivIVA
MNGGQSNGETVTLEEALKRIEELEKENAELREELEYYRNRKLSGRQKHNAKWMEEFYGRR